MIGAPGPTGPTVRSALVDEMVDGIVVLDVDGRVVDANHAARRALGDDVLGEPVTRTAIGSPDGVGSGLVEVTDDDGTSRTYAVSSTALSDFRGDTVGRFVLLRDITELQVLRDQEQRLSVLNRVLRHNLRNELNVVFGKSEALMDSLGGTSREQAKSIHDAAARMLDMGEKARHVETTASPRSGGTVAVDVAGVAEAVAGRAREDYPAASVTLDVSGPARAAAVGQQAVAVALENLVENAVEHNPAEHPQVDVALVERDGWVRISVADDGPDIPEIERNALLAERETPMEHGSGLGLWLVRWVVEASDGDLTFEANEPTGNVVSIYLRQAPPLDDTADEDSCRTPPSMA